MRIAVTGSRGQVVQSLMERARVAGDQIISLGRPLLDLTDPAPILPALERSQPDIIVSAAAYTAVDRAEADVEAAYAVNAMGAGAVAQAAGALEVPLIHLSTDYVFNGRKVEPFSEEDSPDPLGVYGASKLAGEHAVQAACANSIILRTAWVYSPFGNNFLKTMLRLAGEREEIGVVADQRGNPTSALDIADGIFALAERLVSDSRPELRGIFHMTGSGEASWADFAVAIFEASEKRGGPCARVRPITTAEYPTPAPRPINSRLDCRKLEDIHGVRLPDWRHSMETVVERLLLVQA
ncbi:dTDP-4-dehydrorhamnose reductase [Rhizorhapis suberifaciens]|uniref:dTDP-4-dehydrorhamnose reductase n=1 Tax=Rhizorhapis suberifaciens TaxID=13656 RepID=A0A840HR39_9SPHN|nr:dTDP-4-dehydrorhamnose reductase [Rhizorhapis suberifaciens]MBB4640097.1 dTDP-4-dehydrorhamnose reductase [Rhizorhapis suberifaciens]